MGSDSVLHLHWLPRVRLSGLGFPRTLHYIYQLIRIRSRGTPIVWTAHNIVPHEQKFRFAGFLLTKLVARFSSAIIAHSQNAKAEIVKSLSVDAANVHVIPHVNYMAAYPNEVSVDRALAELGVSPSPTKFLFLGQIRPYKGIDSLLDAFSDKMFEEAILLIAGRPYNSSIDQKITNLAEMDARIRYFPGFIPDEKLQFFFKAADVVVFPYERILSSGAVVLAMSFGKACIAPKLGAMDCLNDEGAIFYDAGEKGLRDAMKKAVERRPALAGMGATNYQRASEWSSDNVARATKHLYSRILACKREQLKDCASVSPRNEPV